MVKITAIISAAVEFSFKILINSGMNDQQRNRALFECIRDR